MLGKKRYLGFFCECCNEPLPKKVIRKREERIWRKDWGV